MCIWSLAFLLTLVVLCLAISAQAAPPPAGSKGVPITATVIPDEGAALHDQSMNKAKTVATLAEGTFVTLETLGLYWSEVTDGTQKGFVPTAMLHMSDWGELDEKSTGKEGSIRFAVFNHGTAIFSMF